MGTIIRILTVLLVIVSCTQLVGFYYSFYYLLDELILLLLIPMILLKKMNSSIKLVHIVLYGSLLTVVCLNFVINFYNLSAFLIKLGYYIKSLLPFIILPICSTYLLKKDYIFIYRFLLLLSLLSFVEYYFMEYVSINSFGRTYPFKLRNGSYRAMSITAHPISFGIMNFVGILIAREKLEIKNKIPYIIFTIALFISQSRIPQLLLIVYVLYAIRNFRLKLLFDRFFYFKRLFVFSIPLAIVLILFLPQYFESTREEKTTRLIAIQKSMNILSNPVNLLLGTGIGSFGTYESVVNNSIVYEEMDFPKNYKSVIVKNKSTGVETFLIMILIEFGLVGSIIYYFIVFNLTKGKISELKLFFILIMILYTLVYPLYTFPFVFLINVFFPGMEKQKKLTNKIDENTTNK